MLCNEVKTVKGFTFLCHSAIAGGGCEAAVTARKESAPKCKNNTNYDIKVFIEICQNEVMIIIGSKDVSKVTHEGKKTEDQELC